MGSTSQGTTSSATTNEGGHAQFARLSAPGSSNGAKSQEEELSSAESEVSAFDTINRRGFPTCGGLTVQRSSQTIKGRKVRSFPLAVDLIHRTDLMTALQKVAKPRKPGALPSSNSSSGASGTKGGSKGKGKAARQKTHSVG